MSNRVRQAEAHNSLAQGKQKPITLMAGIEVILKEADRETLIDILVTPVSVGHVTFAGRKVTRNVIAIVTLSPKLAESQPLLIT